MSLVENYTPDNLIAENIHPLATGTVTVISGEGKLSRGSVLMRNSNNKFVLADEDSGTPLGTAEVILADEVDATSADAVANVYISGDFNTDALIVASGYTLSEADRVSLKNAGVYLVNGVSANPS
jgi:hypothetical protein